jgi:hypothetical protein
LRQGSDPPSRCRIRRPLHRSPSSSLRARASPPTRSRWKANHGIAKRATVCGSALPSPEGPRRRGPGRCRGPPGGGRQQIVRTPAPYGSHLRTGSTRRRRRGTDSYQTMATGQCRGPFRIVTRAEKLSNS